MILPAFGVTIDDFTALRESRVRAAVDTTCGSVLNVWKRGGKLHAATASALIPRQALPRGNAGHGLSGPQVSGRSIHSSCGTARESAARLRFHRRSYLSGGDPPALRSACGHRRASTRSPIASASASPIRQRCWPVRSLAIAEEIGAAIARSRGTGGRESDFRSFDTICSATQEQRDAVRELLEEPLDLMVVIGGFNSSNTISLAALCAQRVPTYHIEKPAAIDSVAGTIHYRLPGIQHREATAEGWLPSGPVRIGMTAGASTPNSKIGEVVSRILAARDS